jgi:exonuclease III
MICVQETWVGRQGGPDSVAHAELWLLQAAEQLHIPPYRAYWAPNTLDHSQRNGVATFLRDQPAVTVLHHTPHASGRLQSLDLSWAGHTFSLLNTYWPSNSPAARHAFLQTDLTPCLQQELPACLLGDFNFTADATMDRCPISPGTALADQALTQALQAVVPALVDVFRHHHPTRRAFTFHRSTCLARLDRALLPSTLLPSSHSPRVLHSPHGDHHAFYFSLSAATPPRPPGPGRRRLPAYLLTDPTLPHPWQIG